MSMLNEKNSTLLDLRQEKHLARICSHLQYFTDRSTRVIHANPKRIAAMVAVEGSAIGRMPKTRMNRNPKATQPNGMKKLASEAEFVQPYWLKAISPRAA